MAGFVAVTLLLYLGTIILRTAGLSTKKEALGMPEGSIRALIAMSLILMFAIIGVTVLYSGMGGEPIQSNGISAAQLERLENVQIISITVVDPAASPGSERFNVTARPELSQAGHDFGLQLLTTVSTLVVAVAGFYFGSRAVAQGAKTATTAAQTAAAQTAAASAAGAAAGTVVGGAVVAAADGSHDDGGGWIERRATRRGRACRRGRGRQRRRRCATGEAAVEVDLGEEGGPVVNGGKTEDDLPPGSEKPPAT